MLLLSYSLLSLFSFCISRILVRNIKRSFIIAAPHSRTSVTFPPTTESIPSNAETEEKI